MSIIVNGIELTEVIYAGVNLDTVKVKKGTAEAVTVFEKITQLATPQNVTAAGTTVSWDAVENATSYAVLADGSEIGTVQAGPTGGTLTINFIDNGKVNGQVIINNGTPQMIIGSQTKVYENVYYFEFRSMLGYTISNQTGSMVGITEHYKQYEINGDGSATIEFVD